ncbi:MAG: SGNH/GDSL hydrolase family protein [Planctomycetaceae bacterium]
MKHPYSRFRCILVGCLCFGLLSMSLQADEKSPGRWEKSIVEIEQKIISGESASGVVLFVGSSSIRLWKLQDSFPDLVTANHGFGGSFLSDSVHFFDRIVVPLKPSAIVVYAGDNDIASGKTPETVYADFQQFVEAVRTKLPECQQVVYIGIKPSVKRWALADKIRETNSMIKADCDKDSLADYADVWEPMLTADGKPNADLLLDDGLHMNEKGYKIWANVVKAVLELAPKETEATSVSK